jgi:sec-independent protein translocase protein TatB
MNILGVGPLELLLILAIALIVVGPERLPEIARAIGKTWRQINNMSRMVTAQWQEELSAAVEQESGKSGLNLSLADPLKEAKADLERVLTAPVTTPIQTISAAKSTFTSAVADAVSAANEPAGAKTTAPPPSETGSSAEPPDVADPHVEAPEARAGAAVLEPGMQTSVTIAKPATTPNPDGTPHHGNE